MLSFAVSVSDHGSLNPWNRFLSLLPQGRTVDTETEIIIQFRFGIVLNGVHTTNGAVALLESAERCPHRSTA